LPKKVAKPELAARDLAEVRLLELYEEIAKIHTLFPELRKGRPRAAADRPAEAPAAKARPARRRPRWTAAMKKAARDRMKKYWADQAAQRSDS